jgi:hypothetical protein
MNLQGRSLSDGMQGEDVALLHTEIAQLRDAGLLDAGTAADEVARQFFGPTTRQAVATFRAYTVWTRPAKWMRWPPSASMKRWMHCSRTRSKVM